MSRLSRWTPVGAGFVAGICLRSLAIAIRTGDAVLAAAFSGLFVVGVALAIWATLREPRP